jgi:hypothetical protein
VGTWNINNKSITGAIDDTRTQSIAATPVIPEYTVSTYMTDELSAFVQNSSSLLQTILPDTQLFESSYTTIEEGSLESKLIESKQYALLANIEFVNFNQNVLESNASTSENLISPAVLFGSISSDTETVAQAMKSLLTPAQYHAKTYFGKSFESILLKRHTTFNFGLTEQIAIRNSFLVSAIAAQIIKLYSTTKWSFGNEIENKNNTLKDSLELELEFLPNIVKDNLILDLESKLSYIIDGLDLNSEVKKNILASFILGANETTSSIVYDALSIDLERTKNSLYSQIVFEFENTKTSLTDSLQTELTNLIQIITSDLALKNEDKTTINFDSMIPTLEENRNFSINELTANNISAKEIFKSVIQTQLENIHSILTNANTQLLENINTAFTGLISNNLDSVNSAISFIIETLNEYGKTTLAKSVENQLEIIKTEIIFNITSEIETIKNEIVDKLVTGLDVLPTILSKTNTIELEQSVTNLMKQLVEILGAHKNLVTAKFETVAGESPTQIRKLLETVKEQLTNDLNVTPEYQNDKINTLITVLLDAVKSDANYSQIKFDLIRDQINSLFFDVEFVNYTQSNYMNITPTLIFDKFNTTQFKFDYVLDTTTEWITDEIDQTGAVKSNISIYANNGRGGDKITNMGTPPDIGPMILYTKEYNYGLGGFETGYDASNMAVKYVNASALYPAYVVPTGIFLPPPVGSSPYNAVESPANIVTG